MARFRHHQTVLLPCCPGHHCYPEQSFWEPRAAGRSRFVFQLLEYRFLEQVINSRADFRQYHTNRQAGAEISPYPSCCLRGMKLVPVLAHCPADAVLRALRKPAACLQGCEQEPSLLWSVSSSLDLRSQKHTDLHGCV